MISIFYTLWRTGSVVTDSQGISGIQNEEPVAYFTGLMDDGSQAIYASASNDKGASFTNSLKDGKPLLTKEQSYNGKDFRDPYVFHFKDKLLSYRVSRSQNNDNN